MNKVLLSLVLLFGISAAAKTATVTKATTAATTSPAKASATELMGGRL